MSKFWTRVMFDMDGAGIYAVTVERHRDDEILRYTTREVGPFHALTNKLVRELADEVDVQGVLF